MTRTRDLFWSCKSGMLPAIASIRLHPCCGTHDSWNIWQLSEKLRDLKLITGDAVHLKRVQALYQHRLGLWSLPGCNGEDTQGNGVLMYTILAVVSHVVLKCSKRSVILRSDVWPCSPLHFHPKDFLLWQQLLPSQILPTHRNCSYCKLDTETITLLFWKRPQKTKCCFVQVKMYTEIWSVRQR